MMGVPRKPVNERPESDVFVAEVMAALRERNELRVTARRWKLWALGAWSYIAGHFTAVLYYHFVR